jgi:hypothetical protein
MGAPILSKAQSPVPWNDVTEQYLVQASTAASWFGTGMSAADFNLDGLEDLTFSNSSGSVVSYVQLPEGGFEQVHEINGEGTPQGVVWLDVDGDDDLDLLVGRRFAPMELHINDDGVLIESAESHGIPISSDWEVRGFAVADYDVDGDLDVYVCMYHDGLSGLSENLLLNNDGDGNFTEVAISAGVGNGLKHTFQGVWFDYDDDGDLDLWVINDRQVFPNALYENQGDGTFLDKAESVGLAQSISAMTATIGDPDNDGVLELFCTDVENEPNLFLEKSGGYYVSTGPASGLDGSRYSWGGCWVDADGDMWSDLMVATYRFPNSLPYDNYFYTNSGQGILFIDQTEEIWTNEQTQLYCLALCDFNHDLAPDVVGFGNMSYVQMLENENSYATGGGGRLAVQLCGTESNRWAVGAGIRVYAGGVGQFQIVTCGSDYMTQQSWRHFFGLGSATIVDSVVVDWPSGNSEAWTDIPVGTDLRLIEGASDAELMVSGTACHEDSAWLILPLNAPDRTVNGEPLEGDSLLLDASGTYVVHCAWMGGLFEWTDTLSWELLPQHQVTVEWTEPLCFGQLGAVGWVVDSNLTVYLEGQSYSSLELDIPQGAGPFLLETLDPTSGCLELHHFELPEPSPLGLYLEYEPALCSDDVPSALAAGYGGTPGYLVNWNGVDPAALEEGGIELTLTDDNGCTLDSSFVVVIPEPVEFDVFVVDEDLGGDASISLDVTGGVVPYSILWNTGETDVWELNGLTSGLYSWVVSDAHGCTALGLQDIINVGIAETTFGTWTWTRDAAGLVVHPGTEFSNGPYSVHILDWSGRWVRTETLRFQHPLALGNDGIPAHGILTVLDRKGQPVLNAAY